MNISEERIIGEIVAEDYRTASVFKSYGIDFCCKGNRTIREACKTERIKIGRLLSDLHHAANHAAKKSVEYHLWPLDKLADYIQEKHHKYVAVNIPLIKQSLEKICKVHGQAHPELFEIAKLFNRSSRELSKHMHKEELVLFPFIRRLAVAKINNWRPEDPNFGTVKNPIQMMMLEHEHEGEVLRLISNLSNRYIPPPDACNTYRLTLVMLQAFEEDFHKHLHLENNILFPKTIALENELKL